MVDCLKFQGWPLIVVLLPASMHVARAQETRTRVPVRRPNVLLVVTDDQRPDTIHALGNRMIETPTLDRLVQRGTVFTRAVSANPICTPSRAEIMTGCSGFRNGVLDFGRTIRPELTTLAQAMHGAGYHTWYVGKWHNDGKPIDRGYESTRGLFHGGGGRWWTDRTDFNGRPVTGYRGWVFQTDDGTKEPEKGIGLTPDISSRFADAAIEYIESADDRPFFLHLNFTAPHDPLLMPTGLAGRYAPDSMPVPPNFLPEHPFDHGNLRGRDEQLLPWPRTRRSVQEELGVYYAVISDMDRQLGRVIEALARSGLTDRTQVIFTSDHGLAIGSHGLRGKQNMYDHTVGVPLIAAGPGIPEGRKCNAQVYLRDLYPTVCEWTHIETPSTVEGASLVPLLDGRRKSVHSRVFCYFRDCQRMMRTDRWKLIYYPKIDRFQLFDLQEDPWEMHDLSDTASAHSTLVRLKADLQDWRQQVHDPLLSVGPEPARR